MDGVRVRLKVGAIAAYEGEEWEIHEVSAESVAMHVRAGARLGETTSVAITELLSRGRLLVDQPAATPAIGPFLETLSDEERRQLEQRRADVLEVLTGYRSGRPDQSSSDEPKVQYSRARSKRERIQAKVAEINGRGVRVSVRTFRRWVENYPRLKDVALLDRRQLRMSDPLAGIDDRWTTMVRTVLAAEVRSSRRSVVVILDEVERRLKEAAPDLGVVPIPKMRKARRALAAIAKGTNAYNGSTKGKRSIANRPPTPYGRLRALWPGHYLLVDTTRLNVFAMVPVMLRWMQVELSVAMDLFSRCIVAVRLTPVSTKAIDVAHLLYESFCPDSKARQGGGLLPYTGLSSAIFCDPDKLTDRPGLPAIATDTIIVDHGKIYESAHVRSVCAKLGISIQPARPWQPTDKAHLERFFRTIEGLLQRLPGYKGADVYGRGHRVEDEAYYYFNELGQIIREWIAEEYHKRPHAGLIEPAFPGLAMSPLDMLRMGVTRAGGIVVPARPDLAYDFLPTAWGKIQHYGVDVNKLKYDGPGLEPWRRRESPFPNEKFPFRFDPDDISRIFFQDPETLAWHELRWIHAPTEPTPFSLEVWEHARRLARETDRFKNPERTLFKLLERWNAGLTGNRAERRMALRRSELYARRYPQVAGKPDGTGAAATILARIADPDTTPAAARPAAGGDDDRPDELDTETLEDIEHFYDDAMEVVHERD